MYQELYISFTPNKNPVKWPKKKKKKKDFPGGPMVRTPFPLQGTQVQFLIGEPRSHMPRGRAKNKIKKKRREAGQGFSKFNVRTNSLEDLVKMWTLESGAGVGAGVPYS